VSRFGAGNKVDHIWFSIKVEVGVIGLRLDVVMYVEVWVVVEVRFDAGSGLGSVLGLGWK